MADADELQPAEVGFEAGIDRPPHELCALGPILPGARFEEGRRGLFGRQGGILRVIGLRLRFFNPGDVGGQLDLEHIGGERRVVLDLRELENQHDARLVVDINLRCFQLTAPFVEAVNSARVGGAEELVLEIVAGR